MGKLGFLPPGYGTGGTKYTPPLASIGLAQLEDALANLTAIMFWAGQCSHL